MTCGGVGVVCVVGVVFTIIVVIVGFVAVVVAAAVAAAIEVAASEFVDSALAILRKRLARGVGRESTRRTTSL